MPEEIEIRNPSDQIELQDQKSKDSETITDTKTLETSQRDRPSPLHQQVLFHTIGQGSNLAYSVRLPERVSQISLR